MNSVYSLDDPRGASGHLFGNKAAGLHRLRKLDLNVPEGLVLTTAFTAQLGASQHSASELADLLNPVLKALGEGPFAVRSSSTVEDGRLNSFAGQFETSLNCAAGPELFGAVGRCLSRFEVAKAENQFLRDTDARMAILIQPMVKADFAGVAFSLHPVTGERCVTIEACAGLGTGVVDAQGDTARYGVNAGTVLYENALAADLPIAKSLLLEIATRVQKIEAAEGFPQDVEWAIVDGQIWILQARPISKLPERWTRDFAAERFPRPVSPLAWSIIGPGFARSLKASFQRMGLPECQSPWFGVFDHVVYGDRVAADVFGGLAARPLGHLSAGLEGVPAMLEGLAWSWRLVADWEAARDDYLVGLATLSEQIRGARTAEEIVIGMRAIVDFGSAYFEPNLAISIAAELARVALTSLLSAKSAEAAEALVTASDTYSRNKTSQIKFDVRRVCDAYRQQAEQGELQRLDLFQDVLRRHAHRESDHLLDVMYPTLGETPGLLIAAVETELAQSSIPPSQDLAARDYFQILSQVIQAVPGPAVAPLMELAELQRRLAAIDDEEHYQTTRMQPPVRRLALSLGEQLAASGALATAEDVFFLSLGELEDVVLRGRASLVDHVVGRKASFAQAVLKTPPWNLHEEAIAVPSDGLAGVGCSPGRVRGRVSIVENLEQLLQAGTLEIVVAPAAPPAWANFLARMRGLVTEAGGPLSHTAIVAREAGLPTIMAARNACTVLRDGQIVEIDGRSGQVRVVE